jgi:hypothetical protein
MSVPNSGGTDVVIHAKEVGGITFPFEDDQTIRIGAISRAGKGISLARNIVDVGVSDQKGAHGLRIFPCPLDVPFRCGGVFPDRPGAEVV